MADLIQSGRDSRRSKMAASIVTVRATNCRSGSSCLATERSRGAPRGPVLVRAPAPAELPPRKPPANISDFGGAPFPGRAGSATPAGLVSTAPEAGAASADSARFASSARARACSPLLPGLSSGRGEPPAGRAGFAAAPPFGRAGGALPCRVGSAGAGGFATEGPKLPCSFLAGFAGVPPLQTALLERCTRSHVFSVQDPSCQHGAT